MKVFINDKEKDIIENISLTNLVDEILNQTIGVAIAVNNNVISKDQWNDYKLAENDKVLVITATKGG